MRVQSIRRQVPALIQAREEFRSRGDTITGIRGPAATTGRLPRDLAEDYRAYAGDIEYTVLSYRTPIAWVVRDRIVIPPVRYSVTTSRHQSMASAALAWHQ
ncbi:hypothetical protein [Bailinhaonella thermotolerans]|uniref:DUF8033 domain-containing protein n=1 Tax=Bailinhaonella thermotolerans TaxID=1070861 RepID=A0A3A4A632_9ACTN|nr:hypothetical protein [Bailinhaonella thermotolerans]RJL24025.1 hypothetical protein D5H75_31865 [Bailinhaonella thermotolerans]